MSADKYKNKYRIPSNRLQGYDYGANGCYYVTICTGNRVCYFGEIVNSEMQLSEMGEVAQSEWLKTSELRPDMNLLLDAFIVMPNHIHCIVFIGDNKYNTSGIGNTHECRDAMECRDVTCCRDAMHCVSTESPTHAESPTRAESPAHTGFFAHTRSLAHKNKFGVQSKNLASIIRGFKIAVTTYARKHHIDFAWQERFHDRIIRDNAGLDNARAYIANNPKNWGNDKFYTK